jgi:hypothetical protein
MICNFERSCLTVESQICKNVVEKNIPKEGPDNKYLCRLIESVQYPPLSNLDPWYGPDIRRDSLGLIDEHSCLTRMDFGTS